MPMIVSNSKLTVFLVTQLWTCSLMLTVTAVGQEYLTGIQWKRPEIVKPGATNADPPSDAIVL
jgi:hypothetical protein